MQVTYCDRCGNQAAPNFKAKRGEQVIGEYCDDCYASFSEWVNGYDRARSALVTVKNIFKRKKKGK